MTACASGGLNEKPAQLPETLPAKVSLDVQWWHILGDEHAPKSFGQRSPVVYGDHAYVGLAQGDIFKIDLSGNQTRLGTHGYRITAPLSLNKDQMVILDERGMVSLADLSLQLQWSTPLNALATEPALMTENRIFVQTIDGRVNAIERITGRLLWSFQDAEPDLTLTGTSTPELINTNQGPAVVTGLANGKLVALNVVDGSVVWEYRITRASGKTEVSRLVDVDAQVTNLGDRLIATAYQGDLIVVDTATGQVLQAREFSTYRSIQVDDRAWYGVNAKSEIVAMNPSTLEQQWLNSDFTYRQLSELVVTDKYLAVSDVAGYLHVLDKSTGEWLGSRHIDYRGAKTDPVPFGDGVLMQGHSTRVKLVTFNQ
ncbi:PQQ-binding-like beta-propeller repeat protein [Reinekea sp. G2M2-21]|uniref:outer membrane protein assembly factor BamB family protein n=1 Tax=Reinekea sp. G2M2-21 TaxID=2788942 RepID=UPI0018A96171|nr:PQQ-binding-like beta-propeller repeat protein [Reinekea sp. G2M2-21]